MSTTYPVTKQRYRSPTRRVDASIGLDEFHTSELLKELQHRGEPVDPYADDEPSSNSLTLSPNFLARLSTLLVCGQRCAAVEELLAEVDPMVESLFSRFPPGAHT